VKHASFGAWSKKQVHGTQTGVEKAMSLRYKEFTYEWSFNRGVRGTIGRGIFGVVVVPRKSVAPLKLAMKLLLSCGKERSGGKEDGTGGITSTEWVPLHAKFSPDTIRSPMKRRADRADCSKR